MKISLASIKDVLANRKAGYEEEILKCGQLDGDTIVLSWSDFVRIKNEYALPVSNKQNDDNPIPKSQPQPPSTQQMAKTALASISKWMLNGAKIVDETTLENRLNACQSCEFWNSSGFHGTGRCMKCGCSTWAKLRMATEKCPIGKW